MSKPTKRLANLFVNLTDQTHRTLQIGLARVISDFGMTAFLLYLSVQTGIPQLKILTAAGVMMVMIGLLGLWFMRRDHPRLGMWLIIGSFWPTLLFTALFVTDFTVPFSMIILIITIFSAAQTLPQKQVNWTIIITVGIIVVALLVDQLALADRLPVPAEFLTTSIIVAALLSLIYAYFVVRDFPNYTLRTKLIISFVIVGIISVASVAFLNYRFTENALINSANRALLGAASQTADTVDTFITTNLKAVEIEAQLPPLVQFLSLPPDQQQHNSPEAVAAINTLQTLSRKDPGHISSYALLDRQGRNILDILSPDIGTDESDQDYFQIPLQSQQPYVSPVLFSETSDNPFIYFSSPVRNLAGEMIGILRFRYSMLALQQLIAQKDDLTGLNASALLLDESHLRLADSQSADFLYTLIGPLNQAAIVELRAAKRLPNKPVEALSTNLVDFAKGLENIATQPIFAAEVHPDEGGHLDQIAVAALKTRPWFVAFVQDPEIAQAPLQSQARASLLWAVAIASIVAVGAFALGQFLAGPIIRLTAVAQEVAAGDLQVQAPIEAQDEIGQLAIAFNQMTAQLRNLFGSLEEQVQKRTAELALSIEVGQRAAAIRNLDELLPTIVELIQERFNLYHTQIYFVDDPGQNLILRAGTGSLGQELLARRHSLPVGHGSIVGQVAAQAQPIVVPNTEASDLHKPSPFLPETRAELAIPLMIEGQVMGVLDLQSDRINTFTKDNLTIFEAMATQLAISIDSARQWTASQEAQRKAEEAIRQLTRQRWAETLSSRRNPAGYVYDLSNVKPLSETNGPGTLQSNLSVPVIVQNEPIGQLSVNVPAEKQLSVDEKALLAAVAQQLAQKAENLRLFEVTQQRATREQFARQITDKIRASRNIEAALKTAAAELSKVLGVAKTVVDLKVDSIDDKDQ
jgi:GAF domain-containing protein/HAMP domain-containing protein